MNPETIARVRIVRYRVPFRTPYVTAAGSVDAREGFIMQLETAGGVCGYGEGSLLPHQAQLVDGFEASLLAAAEDLPGSAIGLWTNDQHPGLHPLLFAPLSIAAWDAVARMNGVPLARLLNPNAARSVAVNALIGGGDASSVRVAAAKARDSGYGTVKLKVGVVDSVEGEQERVAAARDALGPSIKLRLDANGAWEDEQAIEVLRAVTDYDIEYVEQPVAPGRLAEMQQVRRTVRIPIAADEDVASPETAQQVIASHAVDYVILKPLQLGGVNDCRRIAREAGFAGIGVTLTTSIDTGIGTASALHLAAAFGSDLAHGLSTLDLIEHSLIDSNLRIEAGRISVPETPGLGVELDEAALARYATGEWEFST